MQFSSSRWLLSLLLTATACGRAATTECGDLRCPEGKVCAEKAQACVLDEQLAACRDHEPGERCAYTNVTDATCVEEVCVQNTSCGDGHVDEGEACDDGNNESGDGCRGDCRSDESCGNGELDYAALETCDDGNRVEGDGCSEDCILETCGDHHVQPNEVCDDGNNKSGDGCRKDCQSREICGDGNLDSEVGEQCDDGNQQGGDGCSQECTLEFCGNHQVDAFEVCDDGNNDDGDGCSSNCQSTEQCGNGYLDRFKDDSGQPVETCDDGGNTDGDGCSSSCHIEACSDRTEVCDDAEDQDCDGLIDCQDPDCWSDAACSGPTDVVTTLLPTERGVAAVAPDGDGGIYVALRPGSLKAFAGRHDLGCIDHIKYADTLASPDESSTKVTATRLAGTCGEGSTQPTVGVVPATMAEMGIVAAMATNLANSRLYFISHKTQDSRNLPANGDYVRYVDLQTGDMHGVAGYAGSGGPSDALLFSDVAVAQGKIFLFGNSGLYRLNESNFQDSASLYSLVDAASCSPGQVVSCPESIKNSTTTQPHPGGCRIAMSDQAHGFVAGNLCITSGVVGLGVASLDLSGGSPAFAIVSATGPGALPPVQYASIDATNVAYSSAIVSLNIDPLHPSELWITDNVGIFRLYPDGSSYLVEALRFESISDAVTAPLKDANFQDIWSAAFLSDGDFVFGELEGRVKRYWR
jgi:cysteine-rich repeat protein